MAWYHEGLRFRCTGCGDCCSGEPGFVWVTQAEIDAMARHLDQSPAEFEQRYVRAVGVRRSLIELRSGDCVFLDRRNGGCLVYPARPRQCRTWPFWAANLRSPQTWQETAEACPGCNKGQLHRLEEIQQRLGRPQSPW